MSEGSQTKVFCGDGMLRFKKCCSRRFLLCPLVSVALVFLVLVSTSSIVNIYITEPISSRLPIAFSGRRSRPHLAESSVLKADQKYPNDWRPHNKKLIFIWTQIRSGSTFFSDFISTLPNVYLSIEPMRMEHKLAYPIHDTSDELLHHLNQISSCNFSVVPLFENRLFNDYCETFQMCEQVVGNTLQFLSFMCRRANIHIMKIVSVRLDIMIRFMREHPQYDVKILNLVRDPRGIMTSLYPHTHSLPSEDGNTAEVFCSNTKNDLISADKLEKLFPHRYLMVRYEDLAVTPVALMRRVLEFLGESYSAKMLTTHRRLTNTFSSQSNEEPASTMKYSKKHAFDWRTFLPFKDIKAVQEICHDVLKRQKLRIFYDETQCKNDSIDVRLYV